MVRIIMEYREFNTALGIEEPECVYACVRASEFAANSLWFEVCVLYVYPLLYLCLHLYLYPYAYMCL